MSFAERFGYKPVRTVFQTESLDEVTRISIWNLFEEIKENFYERHLYSQFDSATKKIWSQVWVNAADEFRSSDSAWSILKKRIVHGIWFDVLDDIENICMVFEDLKLGNFSLVRAEINLIFEKNMVAFRMVQGKFVPSVSETDVRTIEEGFEQASNFPTVQHHLSRSLDLLSNRDNPDYLNSVKESISAVESRLREISGTQNMADALKELKPDIHPALYKHFASLYGWASDESAIRHGGKDVAEVNQSLATYILNVASAAITYFNNLED